MCVHGLFKKTSLKFTVVGLHNMHYHAVIYSAYVTHEHRPILILMFYTIVFHPRDTFAVCQMSNKRIIYYFLDVT